MDKNKALIDLKKYVKTVDLYEAFQVDTLKDVTDEDIKKYTDLIVSAYFKLKED